MPVGDGLCASTRSSILLRCLSESFGPVCLANFDGHVQQIKKVLGLETQERQPWPPKTHHYCGLTDAPACGSAWNDGDGVFELWSLKMLLNRVG